MTMVTTQTLGDSSGSSSGSGSLIDYIINTTNTSNDVSISAFRSVYWKVMNIHVCYLVIIYSDVN